MLVLASLRGEFDISCEKCYVYLEALMEKLLSLSKGPFVLGKIVRQDN